ncbi:MAG: hypothetical protein JWN27_4208 [Candidatus Eremiobacteraeota bacterium]|nr:hypothetical protein [Candidatus Eremiobacteraeota bacterium]
MPPDRATFLAAVLAPLGWRDPFTTIEAQHGGTTGSTALMLQWMRATTTGTYENVANDVGLLYPPSGPPIAIACYTIDVHGDGGSRAIADAAQVASRTVSSRA